MSTSNERVWMYKMTDSRGFLSLDFCHKLDEFLDFAYSNETCVDRRLVRGVIELCIKCPCSICRNTHYKSREDVRTHVMSKGFMPNYTTWYNHGETKNQFLHVGHSLNNLGDYDDGVDGCTQMVMDAMGPDDFNYPSYNNSTLGSNTWEEQDPNPDAKGFYDMLQDADEPLYVGCQKWSKLEAASRLLSWKSECNVPETTYNKILPIVKDMLPDDEKLVGNFYETKKSLKKLRLPKIKIHACKNHCMLFYKEHDDLSNCSVCGESRYKNGGRRIPNLVLTYMPITPRLQRLFMSKKTAKEMTWHYDHQTQPDMMVHPSDGAAWKHFDSTHVDFASEIRNVRLGLCTDGFNPNSSNSNPYSLWPVFLTIYNLPPWMCLKESYVKLALVIPGRKSPGQNIDVFLRPLIDELKMLYNDGILTYDAYRRNNFQMRAVLLWTVSDFPAYAMLSGWSTHGRLACPYCMGSTNSFQLQNGGKPCWFDCHRRFLNRTHRFRGDQNGFMANRRVQSLSAPPELTGNQIWDQVSHLETVYEGVPYNKKRKKPVGFGVTHNWVKRSIFWELPYWHELLIRHNLDVMHIEKNVFENLFHTIMDTPKTKDNIKSRADLELYCNRPELHILRAANNKVMKPKATYTLSKPQVRKVCEWLKTVKFPDGYASNIGGCVNQDDYTFYSFKSHDCHVFMQRLLPIALRGMVPNQIWDAITELCTFFRIICSKVLHVDDLEKLKISIVETICKLEKVFPPSFFDSMEHLVIHLTHEAIISGPVQYRWMYLYERRLGSLKRTIRNKARVEGSIVESYLVDELSTYCSLYYEPTVETRLNREPRNFAPDIPTSSKIDTRLSIFKVPSRRIYDKGGKSRALNEAEMHKIHTYILLNCEEVHPFIKKFDKCVRRKYPNIAQETLDIYREDNFAKWFEELVMGGSRANTKHLKDIAQGPLRYVQSHKGYFVNGYKFHTLKHGEGRVTHNSGVCVKGSCYDENEFDYYGLLEEVLEVEYHSNLGCCIVVVFKCHWFDPVKGVKVDTKHNLVDIKYKSSGCINDPFVLASQAVQVYYAPYPSKTKDLKDWWVVVKTKPRGIYEIAECVSEVADDDNVDEEHFFQENERFICTTNVDVDVDPISLVSQGELQEVGETTYIEDASVDDDYEEEEFEDDDDDEDSDEESELILSDHSSDDM